MKKIVLIFGFFVSAGFLFGANSDSIKINDVFGVKYFTLENGLKVYLNEDHSKPEVFGMVITKAGGKNDPADATGMAHYMEHMLFKGTTELGTTNWEKEKPHIDTIFALYDSLGKTQDEEKRKIIQEKINKESVEANKYAIPNEFSNILNSIGSTGINAGTDYDKTVFYNSFPPNQMEKWLEIYSHRFMEPVFRSFQAELEVVYEEKNMYSDMFFSNIQNAFLKSFFKKHPYGQQTLIGSTNDLKNPSLTKMYDFFKTYYVANNMALIISGDFNSEEVIPLIQERYGRLRSAKIPEQKVYEEKPFNGREFIEKKLSPISLGILGYRTVPANHEDMIKLEVFSQLLSNQSQTGVLDKLTLDNKLMGTMVLNYPFLDQGLSVIFFIPKIIGQKTEDAEELIIAELKKLKAGSFEEKTLTAIKKQMYKNHQLEMENFKDKALMIGHAFTAGLSLQDIFMYNEKLNQISKEDIVEVANKYYGDNYLAFYSKMGFPKKDKIEKPGYEPVVSNAEKESAFAKKLDKIETGNTNYNFIDFGKDVAVQKINEHTMYCVENPANDIFTLNVKYGIGKVEKPVLKYAADIMNYATIDGKTLNMLKSEFGRLGVAYRIYANDSYVEIYMDGIEDDLEEALKLLNNLLTKPQVEQEKVSILYDGEKAERKIERSEPDMVAEALFEYLRFGEKSAFLNRLTMKEVKKLEVEDLVNNFKNALSYEAEIHYVGKKTSNELATLFTQYLPLEENPKATKSPVFITRKQYNDNYVYLVNKKKAVQSKVFFFMNGKQYEKEQEAVIDAFNMYFGGGFSGLVLQEIREYRSMAYAAGARYKTPIKLGKENEFMGYVGTQADKTNDAVEIFVELVRNMPEKKERMKMIKNYMQLSAITSKPDFRKLSEKVVQYNLKGFDDDPNRIKLNKYKDLTFDDIVHFYTQNMQNNPLVIAVVGDKKKMNLVGLAEEGELIKIKEKALFSK